MSAQITYITTCKGRLCQLLQTLPRAVAQVLMCIVVDCSSPERRGAWVESNLPCVTVVRVEGQAVFSAAKARNAGAAVADTPWLAFVDADIVLAPRFAELVAAELSPGFFYRAAPVTPQTWGTIVCAREDFVAAGGYDEAYDGWGGEDD